MKRQDAINEAAKIARTQKLKMVVVRAPIEHAEDDEPYGYCPQTGAVILYRSLLNDWPNAARAIATINERGEIASPVNAALVMQAIATHESTFDSIANELVDAPDWNQVKLAAQAITRAYECPYTEEVLDFLSSLVEAGCVLDLVNDGGEVIKCGNDISVAASAILSVDESRLLIHTPTSNAGKVILIVLGNEHGVLAADYACDDTIDHVTNIHAKKWEDREVVYRKA